VYITIKPQTKMRQPLGDLISNDHRHSCLHKIVDICMQKRNRHRISRSVGVGLSLEILRMTVLDDFCEKVRMTKSS
jgi:hypothetical protein